MGRPSKCEEVKTRLLQIIADARAAGEQILPGERDLASLAGVSRSTLRKVLFDLESAGVISRENQMTRCLPLKNWRGRYAFCAASSRDCRHFFFEFYHRLWDTLRSLAGNLEIDLIFVPHVEEKCSSGLLEKLSHYDIVFTSYLREETVLSMIAAGLPLVMLDQQNTHPDFPLIGLDNTAAGELAARKLLEYNCRHALTIEYCIGGKYTPFELRREGFRRVFEQGGGKVSSIVNSQESDNPLLCITSLARSMEAFLQSSVDSVFYLSDEMTGFLNWYWFRYRNIPEDLKIISFLGNGELCRHHPLPDHVAMDEHAAALEILFIMERFEKQNILPEVRHKMIMPVYRAGETIVPKFLFKEV